MPASHTHRDPEARAASHATRSAEALASSRTRRPHATRAFALCLLLLALATPATADPRPPDIMDGAEIRLALRKLSVTGTALFVAAHPDDENTAFLTYLSKGRMVRAVYLSTTRGDGGQNLIGADTGERLGVIRTQELIGARRVDGAEQLFTRALDFGFSKRGEETLEFWGRERILADVVWAIRRLRPDVIVSRFPPDSTAGHGHHTASGMLAEEAYEAAADSTRFPEQLAWARPWRARRLVWNAFRFGGASADTTPGRLIVDVGAYDPLLGRSYTEIAGESRSMHKSQGFGAAERRGTWTNSFEHRAGDRAPRDLFDGVDLTWKRVRGGAPLVSLLAKAERGFDPRHPQASLPALLEIHTRMASLPDEPIVQRKREELLDVIRSCAGLWLEAIATTPVASPGARIRVAVSALARADSTLRLEAVELVRGDGSVAALERHDVAQSLQLNRAVADTFRLTVPDDLALSHPYWLRERAGRGWSEVPDARMIGTAENAPALGARFVLATRGTRLEFEVPVVHRWVDPVAGERYRAFDVVPPVSLGFDEGAYLFADASPREVRVSARGADVAVAGELSLTLPSGWSSTPERIRVALAPDADTVVTFRVSPASAAASNGGTTGATMSAGFETDAGRHWDRQRITLDYAHIPIQTLLPLAEARLVRADLRISGGEVGYVMGSGDQIPQALRQMGFKVALLDDETLERGDLSRFSTIVTGVRAYNTRPRLIARQRRLLDWVSAGGRLVVQYNTSEASLQDRLGPWPFRISRERVTVEEAEVTLLDPAHPLVTTPNAIAPADFSGWVQERGLYFAQPWDPQYQAPLSCHDPGEPARKGGLLFARHGRGVFVYSGYAWFRQLPAGVPGAWRLFANLVSAER